MACIRARTSFFRLFAGCAFLCFVERAMLVQCSNALSKENESKDGTVANDQIHLSLSQEKKESKPLEKEYLKTEVPEERKDSLSSREEEDLLPKDLLREINISKDLEVFSRQVSIEEEQKEKEASDKVALNSITYDSQDEEVVSDFHPHLIHSQTVGKRNRESLSSQGSESHIDAEDLENYKKHENSRDRREETLVPEEVPHIHDTVEETSAREEPLASLPQSDQKEDGSDNDEGLVFDPYKESERIPGIKTAVVKETSSSKADHVELEVPLNQSQDISTTPVDEVVLEESKDKNSKSLSQPEELYITSKEEDAASKPVLSGSEDVQSSGQSDITEEVIEPKTQELTDSKENEGDKEDNEEQPPQNNGPAYSLEKVWKVIKTMGTLFLEFIEASFNIYVISNLARSVISIIMSFISGIWSAEIWTIIVSGDVNKIIDTASFLGDLAVSVAIVCLLGLEIINLVAMKKETHKAIECASTLLVSCLVISYAGFKYGEIYLEEGDLSYGKLACTLLCTIGAILLVMKPNVPGIDRARAISRGHETFIYITLAVITSTLIMAPVVGWALNMEYEDCTGLHYFYQFFSLLGALFLYAMGVFEHMQNLEKRDNEPVSIYLFAAKILLKFMACVLLLLSIYYMWPALDMEDLKSCKDAAPRAHYYIAEKISKIAEE
ncbi:hypothetical protein NECID01_1071 [Nematocida sp. AWRm77]|nr:hypothetical protein NECID01_1071 [Nematocida sp. AWRm77]